MQPPAVIDMVLVFVSSHWVEAEMVACALEGYEIPTLLLDDNVCRIYPQAALVVGGVKVLVRSEDLSGAIDVLQPAYGGDAPFVGGFLTIPLSLPAALITSFLGARENASAPGGDPSSVVR